jgi:hypothetical protein
LNRIKPSAYMVSPLATSTAYPMPPRDPSELPPAAQRALAEAKARREKPPPARPKEVSGPAGPEPTRYGDWERKGIASDF